ncbi:hypothetical protein FRB90_000084 [Tulasnella sp. 427]|nr:hypothetical protein FRB90_000084 [Tulasnella sp. 427]
MVKTSAVFPHPVEGVTPTPRVYTEEQKAMIEELRHYALSLLLPESDPYHPNERKWIEEAECPARYMRAAKWKLEDGKRRIKGTIEWRREYKPDLISAEQVKIENDSGKMCVLSNCLLTTLSLRRRKRSATENPDDDVKRAQLRLLNGFDFDGRPIITMRVGRQNTQPSERQILHLIFCLERAIDYMPEGQDSMLILVDYKSATLKSNPSISTALKVLHILQDHYVERLGRAIVTNLPMLLNFFFKGIGPFLDPVTRDKMKFNPNLHELIPAEHLEVEFGGKFDYAFDPDLYWEQICRHCGVNPDGSRSEPEWKVVQKQAQQSEEQEQREPKPVDSETSSTAPDLVADDDDVESSRAPSVQLPRASKPVSVKGGTSGKDQGVEVIGEEEASVLVAADA